MPRRKLDFRDRKQPPPGSIECSRKLRWGQLFSMPVSPLGPPGGLMSFRAEFA